MHFKIDGHCFNKLVNGKTFNLMNLDILNNNKSCITNTLIGYCGHYIRFKFIINPFISGSDVNVCSSENCQFITTKKESVNQFRNCVTFCSSWPAVV